MKIMTKPLCTTTKQSSTKMERPILFLNILRKIASPFPWMTPPKTGASKKFLSKRGCQIPTLKTMKKLTNSVSQSLTEQARHISANNKISQISMLSEMLYVTIRAQNLCSKQQIQVQVFRQLFTRWQHGHTTKVIILGIKFKRRSLIKNIMITKENLHIVRLPVTLVARHVVQSEAKQVNSIQTTRFGRFQTQGSLFISCNVKHKIQFGILKFILTGHIQLQL